MEKKINNLLGKDHPRVDGYAKVTGKAVYGNDIQMPGMLHAVCRYADIPAGRILNIDTSEAEKVAGVVKIARYEDIPGNPMVGVIIKDYPPIVEDQVRFMGDVVAVVAAETYEAACLAADKIKVEYEQWKPIGNVHDALKDDARLIQPGSDSNIVATHHTVKGDAEAAFAKSAHVIERTYEVGFQEHGYIEPESITGFIDPTTRDLVIAGSLQNPHAVRDAVAAFVGKKQSDVEVRKSVVGGAFGGKDHSVDNISCRAGLMALLTGRPVKFTYTREHSILESTKRHPYHMTYKVGFDESGRIQGMKVEVLADSGAYAACTPFVTWRSAVQACGPYDIDHVRVDVKGIYTNNSVSGAMRGFGSPQVNYASESLMDEIAEICGLSPVEIREINALKQDSTSITGQKFDNHTVSAIEVLEKATAKSEYQAKIEQYKKHNATSDPIKYGVGLAISYRGCSMGAEGVDTSSALVSVNPDGSVNVSTGVSENGQGLQTAMTLIAAEELGVKVEDVNFTEPSSLVISDGGPTVASRATFTGGNAVKNGATEVKQRIFDVIAKDLEVETLDQTEWKDGVISNKARPELNMTFADAANATKWAGKSLAAYGWFDQPEIHWDEEEGHGSPYSTWVYACQVVDLKVDTSTGKLELLNITAVHDVGQVISTTGFEGQVTGGIAQGFGMGVLEDYNIEHGKLKSENLDSYLLPTIKDIPSIDVIAVENHDAQGPFGAKSIGEPACELAAAAINNAVCFALDTRIRQLPLTLEQVTLGYNLKKPARQSEEMISSEEKKHTHRLNSLRVQNPTSLEHALELLADGKATALAGGTDVLVQGRLHNNDTLLINIAGLPGLSEITETDAEVAIGGGVVFNDLTDHSSVYENFPLLAEACHTVGSHQIRNRATVGGNIVNAAPCADSVPPLIAYGADVELRSRSDKKTNTRRMPLAEFITGGYRTLLETGELLTRVIIPKPQNGNVIQKYSQLGRRNALNITRLSLTALITVGEDSKIEQCHLVDGALFSKPQRLTAVEEVLVGKELDDSSLERAHGVLLDMIDTQIGGRWSAKYKMPVYLNMFRDLMNEVRKEIQEGAA